MAVLMVHTYHGSAPPVEPSGVGVGGVGNAVRTSLIVVASVYFLFRLPSTGAEGNFHLSG